VRNVQGEGGVWTPGALLAPVLRERLLGDVYLAGKPWFQRRERSRA
jgi:hypothetical protein